MKKITLVSFGLLGLLPMGSPLPLIAPAVAQPIRPELRMGSSGTTVSELQTTLRLLDYYQGDISGVYDENTVISVYQFQQAAGIPQTGVMDALTWQTLFPISANTPPATNNQSEAVASSAPVSPETPTPEPASPPKDTSPAPAQTATTTALPDPAHLPLLKEGMENEKVKFLQNRLHALGYYNGAIDGAYGPETRVAVIAAQTAFDVDADGIVGYATWSKLLN